MPAYSDWMVIRQKTACGQDPHCHRNAPAGSIRKGRWVDIIKINDGSVRLFTRQYQVE